MTFRAALFLLLIGASLSMAPHARADIKKSDTIESLEGKEVEIRPGKVIVHSTDLARDNYRAFLELAVDDPDQRAEAMRRLGDLELDATEAAQLVENIDEINEAGYNSAVQMYEQLLKEFPGYRRNDTVMYQLGRAYEMVGRMDESLAVLNKLVVQYPDTPLIDEVQFRRGEMVIVDGIAFYLDPKDSSVLFAASPSAKTTDERMSLVVTESIRVLPQLFLRRPILKRLVRGRTLVVRLVGSYAETHGTVFREETLDWNTVVRRTQDGG